MIETNSLPFDDVFRDVSSKANKLDQSEFSRSGKYPIIDQGQDFIAGYTDDSTLLWTNELPIIIFGDHTRIVKFIDFPFVAGADGTKVLEVDKNVDTKFAYFALQNLDVPSAGYSRHFKFLKEAFFRIPPLEQQRHIATILSRADRLRRLRKYALDISDSYLQGVFLEVFGDPSTNPKRWNVFTLRDLSRKFSDGPFGSNLKSEHYTENGIRVLRLQNIGVGQFLDGDKAYVSKEHFANLVKHTCLPGDIIIGTMGDPNLRACILPSYIPIALNKADCVQFRADPEKITAEYGCQLLNMPQTLHLAHELIHGQTRERISMGSLAELSVPCPPLELQHHFAQIVRKHERLCAQQQEALRQAEHLYQTLLHQAFTGELN